MNTSSPMRGSSDDAPADLRTPRVEIAARVLAAVALAVIPLDLMAIFDLRHIESYFWPVVVFVPTQGLAGIAAMVLGALAAGRRRRAGQPVGRAMALVLAGFLGVAACLLTCLWGAALVLLAGT